LSAQPTPEDTGLAFFATCPFGLAEVLAAEIRELGADRVEPAEAGVAFRGDMALAWRCNFESRIATRVLWNIAAFDYQSETDIYERAKAVIWPRYFAVAKTFKIEINARRSPLKSLNFAALRVKDAIVDRFRETVGSRPNIDTRTPNLEIHVFLDEKRCQLYIDTSGEPLFKRGKRDFVGVAPLKKNLAAGVLRLAGWKPGVPLLDPMCGSGTFLVEAAEMTIGRPAGTGRTFGFEHLTGFDRGAWLRYQKSRAENTPASRPPLWGADLYGRSVDNARANLATAGLTSYVELKQVDLLQMRAPAEVGMLVTNPPYGERIGEKAALAEFYPKLGNLLKREFSGWTACLFSGDPELPKLIRLSPSRKPVLYNGKIECRLFEYPMVAGSNRERRDDGDE
jgi:putative N6-adenine-specific DNA methylase